VNRWKSPQIAAKHAERAAKAAAELRKEKRNGWLIVIGIALALSSIMFADYLWLRARARQRYEQRLQSGHRPTQTNAPANAPPGAGRTNATESTE
jgi:hypothetical protein